MADLSDVEITLVETIKSVLYPMGCLDRSTAGIPVRIYRGWPLVHPLAVDMEAGVANVSVFSVPGSSKNTTRWLPLERVTEGSATLTATTSGTAVTFAGLAMPGQIAGILIDDVTFVHRCVIGDTPALVAAVLWQAIQAARVCWLSGHTVSTPGARRVVGRVVADGVTTSEWARQTQEFRITIWCADPLTRDSLSATLGNVLSSFNFLLLNDGSSARLRYKSTVVVDAQQDANEYRRDLLYDVEYGTTASKACPSLLFGDLVIGSQSVYG